MTVGERIKERRTQLDISADYIADKLGVSRSTIFRYERGDIEKVPIQYLEKIARMLNTSVAYLMGWENDDDYINNSDDELSNTDKMLLQTLKGATVEEKLQAIKIIQALRK